jgi:rsbT antagonist protein RsbS
MGAKTFISGMKPDIALTLETMGVELKGVRTTLDLESALQLLGVEPPLQEGDDSFEDESHGERGVGREAAAVGAAAGDFQR